jgi:hypothetical protein
MEGVLASFAQFDNDALSDRTRACGRCLNSTDGPRRRASAQVSLGERTTRTRFEIALKSQRAGLIAKCDHYVDFPRTVLGGVDAFAALCAGNRARTLAVTPV